VTQALSSFNFNFFMIKKYYRVAKVLGKHHLNIEQLLVCQEEAMESRRVPASTHR
jgi:hypothetical protein